MKTGKKPNLSYKPKINKKSRKNKKNKKNKKSKGGIPPSADTERDDSFARAVGYSDYEDMGNHLNWHNPYIDTVPMEISE